MSQEDIKPTQKVEVTQIFATQEGSTGSEPLTKVEKGKKIITIIEGPGGSREEIDHGDIVLNDYEELERGEHLSIKRVRFNGKELSVGQEVVLGSAYKADDKYKKIPAGTKVTIELFDPGSDTWMHNRTLWVFAHTTDSVDGSRRSFQGDPCDFVGYEDTKLDE